MHWILKDNEVWKEVGQHVKELAPRAAERGHPLHLIVVSDDAPALDSQRAHYWATLREIADQAWIAETQFPPDTWHELFAKEFLGMIEVTDAKGKPKLVRRSISRTADPPISVGEMADYTESVKAYAAEKFGIEFEVKP